MRVNPRCQYPSVNLIHDISWNDGLYPATLRQRLGANAPKILTALGNLNLLVLPKTGLFCSARCPGDAILRAYDQAAEWREEGRCVVSGFHSPVEKECLRILLRGKQPIVICLARNLLQRLPSEWRKPLSVGRLLILSAFPATAGRVTAELASQRNEFVAALASEVFIAHAAPGGHLEKLSRRFNNWHILLTNE